MRAPEVLGWTGPFFRIVAGLLSFAPLTMLALKGSLFFAIEAREAVGFALAGAALLGFEVWTRVRRVCVVRQPPGLYQLLRGKTLLGTFAADDAKAWPPLKETTQLVRGLLLYALVGGVGALMAFTDLPRAGVAVVAFALMGSALLIRDRVVLRHFYIKDRHVPLSARDAQLLFQQAATHSGVNEQKVPVTTAARR